jgi:hypothetical protein
MSGSTKQGIAKSGVAKIGAARLGIGIESDGISPAAQSDIIQWLKGGTSDGESLDYRVQTVASDAELRNVGCYDFDGVDDYVNFSADGVDYSSGELTMHLDFKKDSATYPKDVFSWQDAEWIVRLTNATTLTVYPSVSATTFTVPSMTGNRTTVTFVQSGTNVSMYLDGVFVETKTASAATVANVGRWLGKYATHFDGQVYSHAIFNRAISSDEVLALYNKDFDSLTALPVHYYACSEGDGTVSYDVGIDGQNGTISDANLSGLHSTADGIPSHNHRYGFRDSSGTLIPALLDGSAAADGNPITNPAGFVHNESECDIAQTDAAVFGAGTISFWSADGSALDEKTKAQLDTHYNTNNGVNGCWIRQDGNGKITDVVQYDFAALPLSAADVEHNKLQFGGTSPL